MQFQKANDKQGKKFAIHIGNKVITYLICKELLRIEENKNQILKENCDLSCFVIEGT
jgi:hypothetical protein